MKAKYIIVVVATAALLAYPVGAVTPPAGAATYQGTDIYHGSNVLDFAALKRSGHGDFAWVKRSEGTTWQDPKYNQYVAGCKAAGIKWGPYHFLRLNSPADCKKQAELFWSRIKGTGYTILPAVDVESHDGQQTAAGMRACVRAFIDEFQRVAGFKPVLYTYTAYASDYLHDAFADCRLWLADYRGFAGDVPGWQSYTSWQYSGDKAHIAGIDNAADLDLATIGIFVNSPAAKAPSPKAPAKPAWPGFDRFGWGCSNNYIFEMDKALIKAGYSRYYALGRQGASSHWGAGTQRACAAFQRDQGWSGLGADGIPGPTTWAKLQKYM